MKIRYSWLLALVTALVAAPAWSYTCNTDRPFSTPTERFKDNGDGTVTDPQSGMTWMRCALGQTWDGNTCTGKAAGFTWQAAQDEAAKININGGYGAFKDWRVPHIPELAMIAERQCDDPRINLTLFPATPADSFWSATPGRGARKGAYLLSFGTKGAHAGEKEEVHFVRLMRSAPKK